MISDVLSEAVTDIRDYLTRMPDVYPPGDPVTVRITALVTEMDAVRQVLDTPPPDLIVVPPPPGQGTYVAGLRARAGRIVQGHPSPWRADGQEDGR